MISENQTDTTQERMVIGNDRVRVRVRFGDKEIEVEGPQDYVDKNASMFISQMSNGSVNVSPNRDLLIVGENGVSPEDEEIASNPSAPPKETMSDSVDLVSFFQTKSPQSQRDEIVLITYFYQRVLGRESLTLEDYEEAYLKLKWLAIQVPSNMKSSVRNVVDRTKFLYNPERGKFALTLQGEKSAKEIGDSNG